MSGVTMEIKRNGPSLIDKLLKRVDKNAERIVDEAGDDVAADIRRSWSTSSPSSPGSPPAVVTGELDRSVVAIPEHSMSTGRKRNYIRAMAKHASHLEYGTRKMAARPFMRPAMHRARKKYRGRFKGLLR
jgi:HK97 gp10 family phage protein